MSTLKDVTKLLSANAGAQRLSNVFDDFVEMFALALRNTVDKHAWQDRENTYLQVAGRYTKDELNRFAEAFAHVVSIMTDDPCDVLGQMYMELDLGGGLGQFFTPFDGARLIASMNVDGIAEQVARRGFAEVYEPACGAGALLVAIVEAMREKSLNPQQQLHVVAEDLAAEAVHMVYIHLTLLHIPAVVYRRNTLTLETFDRWVTPAHVLGGWEARLRAVDATERIMRVLGADEVPAVSVPVVSAWDDVFAEVAS